MYKSFSMELAGRTLTVDIGRVCAQANGAALIKYGETTVLSTVVASDKPRDGVDFFPLSVEFEEKMYAVGKIPGGFNKREGKASENAILTSRVIDRPMRPLFPKDYRNDVTLNNMVMSVDPECRPEVVGMIGSALVTTMSDIPFDGDYLASVYNNKGLVYLDIQKTDQAKAMFLNAKKILEKSGDYKFAMGTTISNLGFAFIIENKASEATPLFEEAKKLFEEVGSGDMAQSCETLLIRLRRM